MNGQLAKKIRKACKKDGQEYVKEIKSWSLWHRWLFCCDIFFKSR